MYKKLLIITLFFIFSILSFSDTSKNNIEEKFIKAGLIDVSSLDSSIKVSLVNSDKKKNFFRKTFYNSLDKAYLQKELALKLVKAQEILKSKNKNYSLMIYDSARPRSVSWQMYNQLKNTPMKRFVANPKKGSMHNYGAAVDITIADSNGKELDMGDSPFNKNSFQLALVLIKKKLKTKPNKKQMANRKLLNEVMLSAGFKELSFEWWHFNGFEKEIVRKKYKIIE